MTPRFSLMSLVCSGALALGACGAGEDTAAPSRVAVASIVSGVASSSDKSGRADRCDDAAPTKGHDREGRSRGAPCVEPARPHDARAYTVVAAALPFDALPASAPADRWWGVLGGAKGDAGYRIEVPHNWNGKLVMYAHGYAGEGAALAVQNPPIRRHLIEQGYAWAASSYSANSYDVRAGVEDTNALAAAFRNIAEANGRKLQRPKRTYLMGHSMGGHVTGAAIDREARKTANNRYRYDAALPMCGVMGDTELFDYFVAYQLAAQSIAGSPAPSFPDTGWATVGPQVRAAMFTDFTRVPTLSGLTLREVVKNLTGGERPIFAEGFANGPLQGVVWNLFGGDGTVNGIVNANVTDTRGITYQLDANPALSATEQALNASIIDVAATPGANRLRRDGLRWIPQVNGDFDIPVVTLHTLGDMFVPFHMQQIFRRRADAQGNGDSLVQRAIRAPSHCDFTLAEQATAFDDMARWEQTGEKPTGDDVLTPSVVADSQYGCRYTNDAVTAEDSPTTAFLRTLMPRCSR
jgi:hypothetical protein